MPTFNSILVIPTGERARIHLYSDSIHRNLAERVGIEPTVPLPGQQFSRLPDSATLAPLREPKDHV